jgi:uncharacterized protein (TIGR02001 family)
MNMNKKLIVLGAVSAIAASSAIAQDLSVTTTFAWESKYVFRGVQLAEETFMPSIDFAYGGAYFGVWTAQPVDDEANEVDYYAGYSFEVSELISLDVGATVYTYPDSDGDSTAEIFIGAAFDVALSPAIYLYRDLDLDTTTLEASAGYSWPMDEKLSIDLSGAVGFVEPDSGDSYAYGTLSAAMGYAFNDYASASLYVNFSAASEDYEFPGDSERMRSSAIWFGFSVTAGF